MFGKSLGIGNSTRIIHLNIKEKRSGDFIEEPSQLIRCGGAFIDHPGCPVVFVRELDKEIKLHEPAEAEGVQRVVACDSGASIVQDFLRVSDSDRRVAISQQNHHAEELLSRTVVLSLTVQELTRLYDRLI